MFHSDNLHSTIYVMVMRWWYYYYIYHFLHRCRLVHSSPCCQRRRHIHGPCSGIFIDGASVSIVAFENEMLWSVSNEYVLDCLHTTYFINLYIFYSPAFIEIIITIVVSFFFYFFLSSIFAPLSSHSFWPLRYSCMENHLRYLVVVSACVRVCVKCSTWCRLQ